MSIITCNDVSIRYITGDFKDIGLKEYLIRRIKGEYRVTEFWADRHVTFSLEHGDMLGIIGSNGAGKSTLLKAISGIMVPTEGTVACNGKVAALLELASGFDGDLTVRENTYLRAAMLGYGRAFVDATYDAIIDFAELRDFQDRPFKQLSSGMKSRLAFSIASLVDPEVLILDEVLSVGDGAFRKKSEAKMRQIIGGGATTILVSHSVAQVRALCNKVLWLDHGRQIAFGSNVQGLCDAYQRYLDTRVLPGPDELPPFDVEPAAGGQGGREGVAEKGSPGQAAASAIVGASGKEPLADAASAAALTAAPAMPAEAAAPVPPRARPVFRKPPKAVLIALAALVVFTLTIAVSEARLPGIVQALPDRPEAALAADPQGGARVYLWDNKLFVFVDRDAAEGAVFAVRATDSHGRVTSGSYDVAASANARYSTADDLVLEVNLAYYPDAVELEYGMAYGPVADSPDFAWSAVYRP